MYHIKLCKPNGYCTNIENLVLWVGSDKIGFAVFHYSIFYFDLVSALTSGILFLISKIGNVGEDAVYIRKPSCSRLSMQ